MHGRLKIHQNLMEYCESNIPLCRENQFKQLSQAVFNNFRLIIVSGPVSSGKTTTVKRFFDQILKENQNVRCSHVYIDVGNTISDVLSKVANQIGNINRRIRTFQNLEQYIDDSNKKTLIAFDSFDLLGDANALALFTQAEAIVDSKSMPNFTFIFITHVNPGLLLKLPLSFYSIQFPAYNNCEIEKIVSSYIQVNEQMPSLIKKILEIVGPITVDIRDIIFIAHKISRFTKLTQNELAQISIRTLNKMRSQQTCRINDLPTLASFILLALYIGTKTSVMSDLMRFARSLKKKKKRSVLFEKNDYVPMERVIALTKALIYSHSDKKIDFDYAGYIQIQNLADLELISIRGDLFGGEAKLVNMASEQEIFAIAQKFNIRIDEYVSEK